MKSLVGSIQIIARRNDSRRVAIGVTLFLMLLLLAFQNGAAAYSTLSFDSLPLMTRISLFMTTFFNIRDTFTASTLLLAILGSLIGGINFSLAYTYMKLRGETIMKSGLYSGFSLVVAFLGIGCAACGTAFLSVLLGFFGFSTLLNILPYQGQEVGYIGLIFLCIATYVLAKKVTAPNVC